MELHPFLEHDTRPNAGWWYVMTTTGEHPSMRVGHTAVHVCGASDGDAGRVYVIGGANPSGPFCETFVLDLNSRCWDTVDSPGLRPRYEHAAFVPASKAGKIYVFGGANQAGNMNDIQVLDTDTNVWTTLNPAGTAPAPRTHHTTACVGDKLIVYSGGHTGADPVGDRQVHCFDAAREEWTVVAVRGDPPKPRHGHAMAAVGSKVLVHGGMAGATFYDDLHVLDLDRQAWSAVKKKRAFPCARAAHAMMAVGSDVYVFGGMNRQGALDDLHKLDTSE
jgi:N-acetylneuraminic acid mutarotase